MRQVFSLAVSADGKFLAAAGRRPFGLPDELYAIQLWDLSSRSLVRFLCGHKERVEFVAFFADGRTLLSASHDGTLRLWSIPDGRERARFQSRGLLSSCRLALGKNVLAEADGAVVRLYDAERFRPTVVLRGHTTRVTAIAFSADASLVAAVAQDGTIRLWEVSTGRPRGYLAPRPAAAAALAFSPDPNQLLSVNENGTIVLWDWQRQKVVRQLVGGPAEIERVAWSRDGHTIVAGATNFQASLFAWDAASGRRLTHSTGYAEFVVDMALLPDGKTVVTGDPSGNLRLWPIVRDTRAAPGPKVRGALTRLAYSPTSATLAAAGAQGLIFLWDLRSGRLTRVLGDDRQSRSEIRALAFAPSGRTLLEADMDGQVRLWDPATGKLKLAFAGQFEGDGTSSFSTDGRLLVWAADTDVCVRAVRASEKVRVLSGDKEVRGAHVTDCRLARDGRTLCVLRGGGKLEDWDIGTGKRLGVTCIPAGLLFTALSGTGRRLVARDEDGVCHLWERGAGPWRPARRGPDLAEGPWIHLGCFSADERYAALVSESGQLELIEFDSAQVVLRRDTGVRLPRTVAFSPDGRELAVCGNDWAIRRVPLAAVCANSNRELERLWDLLGSSNGATAYRAGWMLASHGKHTVEFLHKRLEPAKEIGKERLRERIEQLDDEDFQRRQRAIHDLARWRWRSVPALERAMSTPASLEVRLRIERLLDKLAVFTVEELRRLRSIAVLERIGTPRALTLLRRLARGAPCRLSEEAQTALLRRCPPP